MPADCARSWPLDRERDPGTNANVCPANLTSFFARAAGPSGLLVESSLADPVTRRRADDRSTEAIGRWRIWCARLRAGRGATAPDCRHRRSQMPAHCRFGLRAARLHIHDHEGNVSGDHTEHRLHAAAAWHPTDFASAALRLAAAATSRKPDGPPRFRGGAIEAVTDLIRMQLSQIMVSKTCLRIHIPSDSVRPEWPILSISTRHLGACLGASAMRSITIIAIATLLATTTAFGQSLGPAAPAAAAVPARSAAATPAGAANAVAHATAPKPAAASTPESRSAAELR